MEPQANKGSALPGGSSSSAPGPAASTCPRAPGSEILVAPLLPAQRQIFTQGWAPEGTGVKAWGQRRTHRAAGRGGAQAGRAALSQRPPACRREMLLHSQWAGRAGLPPCVSPSPHVCEMGQRSTYPEGQGVDRAGWRMDGVSAVPGTGQAFCQHQPPPPLRLLIDGPEQRPPLLRDAWCLPRPCL